MIHVQTEYGIHLNGIMSFQHNRQRRGDGNVDPRMRLAQSRITVMNDENKTDKPA